MSLNNFSYSVSWSDFTSKPSRPHGEDEDARIKISYPYSYDLGRNKNAIIVSAAEMNIGTVSVACWAVSSQMSNDLLAHEQGHYDITALGAREFYNTLLTLSAKSEKDIKAAIKKENGKIQKKIDEVNKLYDDKTDHSQNKSVQQQWNKQIAAEKQKPNGSLNSLPQ